MPCPTSGLGGPPPSYLSCTLGPSYRTVVDDKQSTVRGRHGGGPSGGLESLIGLSVYRCLAAGIRLGASWESWLADVGLLFWVAMGYYYYFVKN